MTTTISVLNKPTTVWSLIFYEDPFSLLTINPLDTPLLVYAAKERKGWACGEALGPLQKFSNWLFLLCPCHHQGTARAFLPAVSFCDFSSSMLLSNLKLLGASKQGFLQKWSNRAGQEIQFLLHHSIKSSRTELLPESFHFLNWKGTPLV